MPFEIVDVLGSLLLALLAWGLVLLHGWIRAKVQNELLQGALVRLSTLAGLVVRETYQAWVEAVKADGGGKLTAEQAKQAKGEALAKLKTYLGPKGLKALAYVAGFAGDVDLDDYLGGAIESAIADAKRSEVSTITNIGVSPGSPTHVGLA